MQTALDLVDAELVAQRTFCFLHAAHALTLREMEPTSFDCDHVLFGGIVATIAARKMQGSL